MQCQTLANGRPIAFLEGAYLLRPQGGWACLFGLPNDVVGVEQEIGKRLGKDAGKQRPNIVRFLGIEGAQAQYQEHAQGARDALATAAAIPGTIVHRVARPGVDGKIRVGHPSGTLAIGARVHREGERWVVGRVIVSRSARRLMEGWVLLPQD